MEYADDYKREVLAAFERALGEFERTGHDPDPWESRCLLDALSAIVVGSYGLAANCVERCFSLNVRRNPRPPVEGLTIAGLRAAFSAVVGTTDIL
jgi:hypothetical protein